MNNMMAGKPYHVLGDSAGGTLPIRAIRVIRAIQLYPILSANNMPDNMLYSALSGRIKVLSGMLSRSYPVRVEGTA
jgi:hypothetical protein